MKGQGLDGVIVTQSYHVLSSTSQFDTIRDALHFEDGTLGLLWHRALEINVSWLFACALLVVS